MFEVESWWDVLQIAGAAFAAGFVVTLGVVCALWSTGVIS